MSEIHIDADVATNDPISMNFLPTDVPTKGAWTDSIGIVASVACAIHCAAMPFVIAFLPSLGLSFLADESFHKWMALACFVIAMAAFVPGFRKHGRWIPMSIAASGLMLITSAAFGMTGDCCATCDVNSTNAASTEPCCEHCEHCEHCNTDATAADTVEAETAKVTEVASATPQINRFQAAITPFAAWITPLGGMLLVSAHLLNRRYGCLCGCCQTEIDQPDKA